MTEILRVAGARRLFGGFVAVDDVSFTVSAGEMLGIAGPNGAGKSTLFNLLTGVPYGPSAGSVHFLGRRIDRMSPARISRLGLRRTFQAEAAFDSLTVAQNVEVCASYLGRRRDAARVLELVGLQSLRAERAADLPLLAKKKLMIAGALVGTPRMLLLDEPAGGLDLDDQAQLVALLRRLNDEGLTLIVIEHVLSLLREIAGRMLLLTAGSVLVEGPPEDVLSDPRVHEAYLGERRAE
jgi:branched-chain amino acid transport system ATP-binding protein